MLQDINWIAVLAAGVVSMALGMAWYAKGVFGAKWIALSGFSDAQMAEAKKEGMGKTLGTEFVASLVAATALAVLANILVSETLVHAVKLGALTWLGFSAATGMSDYLFARRPLALFAITSGFRLVSMVAMAVVVTLWR